MEDYKALIVKPEDNVATALEAIPANKDAVVSCQGRVSTITVLDSIEFGHKFATSFIAKGSDIRKYGEVIGRASQDIDIGAHLHTHNIEGTRGRGDQVGKE
ncbi:UxaA family hydrolase [Bacillus piscicola]|uniref:UxaA family hydrolase n=1 Tax=Bacillus piscicola TaxID=1632684 RepID=UPI001F0888A8|nr:UxaA family hydrolase [Bacillus piscicola]